MSSDIRKESNLDTGLTPQARAPLRCDDCGKELRIFHEAPDGSRMFAVCPCVPLVQPGEDPELEAIVDRILDGRLAVAKSAAAVPVGAVASGAIPEDAPRPVGSGTLPSPTGSDSRRCPFCGRRVAILKSVGSESVVVPCECGASSHDDAQPSPERSPVRAPDPSGATGPARPPLRIAIRAPAEPPRSAWRLLAPAIVATAALAAAARYFGPDRPGGALASAGTTSSGISIADAVHEVTPEELQAAVVKGTTVSTATFLTDQEGNLTRVSALDPNTVLHALCRHVAQRGKLVPVSVGASPSGNPDVRTGVALVLDGRGTTRSLPIRRDPRTHRWSAGNGTDPIAFDPAD